MALLGYCSDAPKCYNVDKETFSLCQLGLPFSIWRKHIKTTVPMDSCLVRFNLVGSLVEQQCSVLQWAQNCFYLHNRRKEKLIWLAPLPLESLWRVIDWLPSLPRCRERSCCQKRNVPKDVIWEQISEGPQVEVHSITTLSSDRRLRLKYLPFTWLGFSEPVY